MRRRVDPDVILNLLDRYLADEDVPLDKRLAAAQPYINAGYLRPPTASSIKVESTSTASPFDVAALPLEAQRELLAALQRARAALPAPTDDAQGGDYDGD